MTALSTTWADVEASILADSAAGYTIPEIAARCGWGRQAVAGVLARNMMPVVSANGAYHRGRHARKPSLWERWTDEEKAVVAAARSLGEAQRVYREAFPTSRRGPRAVEARWYALRRRKA